MRPKFTDWQLFAVTGALLAGCAGAGAPANMGQTQEASVNSANGLSMINGLSMLNGLSMINGLSALNGLSSTYGLANGVGLMSSAGGRSTLSYIVRCALPAGHRITKNDQQNISYTFQGEIGVAPEWETGALSDQLSGGGQRLPPRARQHQRQSHPAVAGRR